MKLHSKGHKEFESQKTIEKKVKDVRVEINHKFYEKLT